jgi:hypothetical protein
MPQTLRRMASGALCVLVFAVTGSQSATASVDHDRAKAVPVVHTVKKQTPVCRKAAKLRRAVIKKYSKLYSAQYGKKHGGQLGKRKPGRNICLYGNKHGKKAPRAQEKHYLEVLQRLKNPTPVRVAPSLAPVSTSVPTAHSAPTPTPQASAGSAGSSTMESIAACESGGDPTTNTGNGFYGKYQFTQSTWESVGGKGLPSSASESEQDARAQRLYAQQGSSPWPVCGK